jgi:hypothetical protein
LVKVSRPSGEPLAGLECELHPDGRSVTYKPDGDPAASGERWSLNLLTGEEEKQPAIPWNEEQYFGLDGRICFVENTHPIETQFSRSTYRVLLPDPNERIAPSPAPLVPEEGLLRLPTTFLRGSNLTGRPLQFSPTGKRLAINFQWTGNPVPAMDIINFDGSFNRRRYGFEMTGSVSWNSSGTHLIGLQVDVGDTISRTVRVLDVQRNRIVTTLGAPDDPERTFVGWLGDREVLSYVMSGRNMKLVSTDVFSGRQEEIEAFKAPISAGDLGVVQLASEVVQKRSRAFGS